MERRLFLASLGGGTIAALGLGGEEPEKTVEALHEEILVGTKTLELGPDDVLVLRLPEGTILSAEQLERLGSAARKGFEHSRVVVLEGGIDLAVVGKVGTGTVGREKRVSIAWDSLDLSAAGPARVAVYDAYGGIVGTSEEFEYGSGYAFETFGAFRVPVAIERSGIVRRVEILRPDRFGGRPYSVGGRTLANENGIDVLRGDVLVVEAISPGAPYGTVSGGEWK